MWQIVGDGTEERIDAWWFEPSDHLPLGAIVVGQTHHHEGPVSICRSGLHASRDPFDALAYARGTTLYKVQVWGDVQSQRGKICGRHRMYVARRDATVVLRKFARRQAMSCIDAWNAPEIVRQYLITGDAGLREDAHAVSYAAARASYGLVRLAAYAAAYATDDNVVRAAAYVTIGARATARKMFAEMVSDMGRRTIAAGENKETTFWQT